MKKQEQQMSFWLKKKEPLVLPPDYNELPKPRSITENKVKDEEEKIKNFLKVNRKINTPSTKNSSIEKSILNEIKK